MLKQRLIVILALNNGVLYRTKQFKPDYRYTINFVDSGLVDEVIMLDITRPGMGDRKNFYRALGEFSERSLVPVTAGGGIRSVEEARFLLRHGADMVAINTGAVEQPHLIRLLSDEFGAQAVVVSIDAWRRDDGWHEVYTNFGSHPTGFTAWYWAIEAVEMGAGQILVTSIERDGSLLGYDNILNRMVVDAVTVPVLCAGGVGNWQHLVEALETGVSGVCVSNIFHMTEMALRAAKEHMRGAGCLVRL